MIFFHLHDIPRYSVIIPKFLRLQFVSFLFLFFFSEKSYDKSSRFYPLPSVPELFTPRSVIRNTYLEWIEVKRPRRNERSVFPFQLFLLRFKIIPPHNWRPHVRYVRWLGTDTRRRGKAGGKRWNFHIARSPFSPWISARLVRRPTTLDTCRRAKNIIQLE